jgi:molecular chaperone GrpE
MVHRKKDENTPNGTPPPEQPPSENGPANPDGAASQPEVSNQTPMVALTMEEYDTLQKELDQARAKTTDYFDGWQRERADFTNYKRRVERDALQARDNALISVVKKYLVILDDLERALKLCPDCGEGAAWADGIELIYHKLRSLLEVEGVKRMDAEHEYFDPTRHEAISQEDSPNHKSGQIIEVVQPGYLLNDRVIRPATVRIAR